MRITVTPVLTYCGNFCFAKSVIQVLVAWFSEMNVTINLHVSYNYSPTLTQTFPVSNKMQSFNCCFLQQLGKLSVYRDDVCYYIQVYY